MINFWFLIKIGVLILLAMYLVFSLIIIRQVKLMTDTLQVGYENFIKSLSFAHFIFAVIVSLAALILL